MGMANMELGVKMKPENVLEIGSITKQFTAVGILMLEEQGKLSTNDEITKFIPDYPTNGKKITVHHLLNHTSGIKSYTGMPSFIDFARLVSIGYDDLFYNNIWPLTIDEYNESNKKDFEEGILSAWDEDDDAAWAEIEAIGYQKKYGVNPKFQKWLTETYNVSIPERGIEITNPEDDSFHKWLLSNIKYE